MIGLNRAAKRLAQVLFGLYCIYPQNSAAQVYGPVTKDLGDGARATAAVYDEGGSLLLRLSGNRNGLCPLSRDVWVTGNETISFRQGCDVGGLIGDAVVEGTVEIYGYDKSGSSVTFSVHLRGEAWDDTMFGRGATLGSMNDGWTGIRAMRAPSATFDRIWVDHNVERDGRRGMLTHADVVVSGRLGRPVDVIAFIVYEGSDQPVTSVQGGNLQAAQRVDPGYESSRYSDFTFFFSYSDFNLPSGRTSMQIFYQVFGAGGAFLGTSERQGFTLTR